MPDFSHRSNESELMDEEEISFDEFHDCLQGLETINHLTLAYRPTLRWLRPWLTSNEPIRILDAGSGGGDMLRQVAKQLSKNASGKNCVKLIGVDRNPWAKKSAELFANELSATGSWQPSSIIQYKTADIFNFQTSEPVDIIICSLFTHHLTDTQLINFLRWIDSRARKGWFINDLHRHPVPYYFIKAATALFSSNRLIRNDAAVSVARAFTVADWRRLLERAGIDNARIQWCFPFRLCLSCNKI